MKLIDDELSIVKFMKHTELDQKYKIPTKVFYTPIDSIEGIYVIGMVIGFKTIKLEWMDKTIKSRKEFSWNPEHPSHKAKTLAETGF